MRLLSLLFKRTTRYRHFALLDSHGVCIAFKSCHAKPANEHWIEVENINLSWLGKAPLGRALMAERGRA